MVPDGHFNEVTNIESQEISGKCGYLFVDPIFLIVELLADICSGICLV